MANHKGAPMSERLTLRAFKCPSEEQFLDVFAARVERCGGEIHWHSTEAAAGEDLRTTHQGDVHMLYLPYLSGADYLLCRLLGAALDAPWIETRIQAGSLWDYSLYCGAAHVDDFSTLPEYWDEEDTEAIVQPAGDPEKLSLLWRVPRERIDRYIRHWGMIPVNESTFRSKLQGKAYQTDEHEYGNIYQMFDFLAALGARDPMADGNLHRIVVPPMENLQTAVASLRSESP